MSSEYVARENKLKKKTECYAFYCSLIFCYDIPPPKFCLDARDAQLLAQSLINNMFIRYS